jgi:CBS domain-containing protein
MGGAPDAGEVHRQHPSSIKVKELMSHEVVTVTRQTTLKEVGELLAGHLISGVPVCDADGRILGVVSEADILWKEVGARPSGGGLLDRILEAAFGDGKRLAAITAGEAMTWPAITVGPSASVAWAAQLMTKLNINRLPVVEDDKLVGIIARADLVRAFTRADEDIEQEIKAEVLLRTLWVDPDTVSVVVDGGMVSIYGEVENRSTAELIEAYIRRVPGVVSLHSDLYFEIDDHARRVAASADQLPSRI